MLPALTHLAEPAYVSIIEDDHFVGALLSAEVVPSILHDTLSQCRHGESSHKHLYEMKMKCLNEARQSTSACMVSFQDLTLSKEKGMVHFKLLLSRHVM